MLIQNPSQHNPFRFRTKETDIQEDALEWSGLASKNKYICKETRFNPFTGKEAKGLREQWPARCWHTWSSDPHSYLPISKWSPLRSGRVKTLGHIAILPLVFWLIRPDWAHLVVCMRFSSAVSLDVSSSWMWTVNQVVQIMFYEGYLLIHQVCKVSWCSPLCPPGVGVLFSSPSMLKWSILFPFRMPLKGDDDLYND